MANQPAQKTDKSLSLEGIEPGSPHYEHKKKLIAEEEERKRNSGVVVEQWIEIQNENHPKGAKVRLIKRMADWKDEDGKVIRRGSTHRLYLGRWLKGGREAVAAYKAKRIFVREPKQPE